MIGEALGLIGGLAGAAINSSWQGANLQLALENLRWQKQMGERQFKLSSAGRTDAYGNKQKYDEALNEWILDLTDTQKKITQAGEKEQLLSLTEDAARNRKIRTRQAKRGDQAAKDYDTTLAKYKYEQPKGEDRIRGELQSLLQGISDAKGGKALENVSVQAVRQGRGAMLPQLIRASHQDSSRDWAENLLKSRTMGQGEAQQRSQAHESKYLPALQALQTTMDMGGDMPPRFSDVPNRMAQEQGQQQSLMVQALNSMMANANAAQSQVTKAASDGGIDMKGLASMMSAGGGMGRSFGASPNRKPVEYAENIGSF